MCVCVWGGGGGGVGGVRGGGAHRGRRARGERGCRDDGKGVNSIDFLRSQINMLVLPTTNAIFFGRYNNACTHQCRIRHGNQTHPSAKHEDFS